MREIKFRAWDKEDNRMIVDEQDFIPLKVTNKGVMRLSPHHSEDLWEIIDNSRFEIMQYTGLKDSNGKDIYEGDKVKFRKYMNEYNGTVHFEKGCFIVKWESVVGAYGEKATHSEYLKNCENIEVINS